MLHQDPQIPWALRPLMPWGIYVLPLLAIAGTLLLLNPSLNAPPAALVARIMLVVCGSLGLASSLGMTAQWIIISEKKAAAKIQREVEFEDANIRNIVAEVDALDPAKDLGRLLGHAAANRFEAPRELARKKIGTHPHLQDELALRLTNEWSLEALGYLELNDAPDNATLAAPVRTALESLTPWITREVSRSNQFWPETYASETRMALAVADKFEPYGIDYLPAVKAWRAAFNHPNTKEAQLMAPQLIDAWLARHTTSDNPHATNPRR
jgi:ubiquinone biosynthesis protein UbiJ